MRRTQKKYPDLVGMSKRFTGASPMQGGPALDEHPRNREQLMKALSQFLEDMELQQILREPRSVGAGAVPARGAPGVDLVSLFLGDET